MLSSQKNNHDLTLDARMVVERVELLSWYLQNDTHTVAHLAMVLLEGPFEDSMYSLKFETVALVYELRRYSIELSVFALGSC